MPLFHVEHMCPKPTQRLRQLGTRDQELGLGCRQTIDYRCLVPLIQLRREVVEANDWPFTAAGGIQPCLREYAGQRDELFLSPGQVFAPWCVRK
ncbi:hypothetical protein GCM10027066_15360 [Dyella jejuensis]